MRSLFGISAAIAGFAVLAAAPFVLGEYGLGDRTVETLEGMGVGAHRRCRVGVTEAGL